MIERFVSSVVALAGPVEGLSAVSAIDAAPIDALGASVAKDGERRDNHVVADIAGIHHRMGPAGKVKAHGVIPATTHTPPQRERRSRSEP